MRIKSLLLAALLALIVPSAVFALPCDGQISYPTLNASQNDYTYPGKADIVERACLIKISASTAVSITGIGWQEFGAQRTLINAGSSAITLSNASSSSTAKYRFSLNGDLVLNAGDAVTLLYDWDSQRWRAGGATTTGVLGAVAAGAITGTTVTTTGAITTPATFQILTAYGASWTQQATSEHIVLSTSGATTDSSANLLPANSIIKAVVCTVIDTITTATDWGISDPTTSLRFSAVSSVMTAGTTIVGLKHMFGDVTTTAAGPTQAAAAKLRITTTGTPGDGSVSCTVFSEVFVAPTS